MLSRDIIRRNVSAYECSEVTSAFWRNGAASDRWDSCDATLSPSSLDVTVGTAARAMATAASAADTGMEADTDPVPTTTAPPTAEHISSFLLYIRRRAADDATATAASTAETLA